jgi:hypothetical protein
MIAGQLEALLALLAADSDTSAQISGRAYVAELPPAQTVSMPRNAIVLKLSGGPADGSYLNYGQTRVDVWNYGSTPFEATKTQRASHACLKAICRAFQNNVLIHGATRSSGPISFRTPDTDWPVVVESWLVSAAETTVP